MKILFTVLIPRVCGSVSVASTKTRMLGRQWLSPGLWSHPPWCRAPVGSAALLSVPSVCKVPISLTPGLRCLRTELTDVYKLRVWCVQCVSAVFYTYMMLAILTTSQLGVVVREGSCCRPGKQVPEKGRFPLQHTWFPAGCRRSAGESAGLTSPRFSGRECLLKKDRKVRGESHCMWW